MCDMYDCATIGSLVPEAHGKHPATHDTVSKEGLWVERVGINHIRTVRSLHTRHDHGICKTVE